MSENKAKCWPMFHDWGDWREDLRKYYHAFSVFALPGSRADERYWLKGWATRTCRECGKVQRKYVERQGW